MMIMMNSTSMTLYSLGEPVLYGYNHCPLTIRYHPYIFILQWAGEKNLV
jgi:hypothetical protein